MTAALIRGLLMPFRIRASASASRPRSSRARAQTCSYARSGAAGDGQRRPGSAMAPDLPARYSANTPGSRRRSPSSQNARRTSQPAESHCSRAMPPQPSAEMRIAGGRTRKPATTAITASVSGIAIAVSLHNAAAINHRAAIAGLRSRSGSA